MWYLLESKEWYQVDAHEEDEVQKSQYHGLVVHDNKLYLIAGTQLIAANFYLDNRVCYLDLSTAENNFRSGIWIFRSNRHFWL